MTTSQGPTVTPKGVSGRLVVFGVGIISAVLGFGLLGWMLMHEPDSVNYEQSGPTQPDVVFPPPVHD